jgi:hypothetical protein
MAASPKAGMKRTSSKDSASSGIQAGGDNIEDMVDRS